MLKRLNLSGNVLKIIACLSMLIDHAGLMLFPSVVWLRYIGRLAFPIFAFLISEGCRYTKNKLRYFLSVFLLGAVCQIAYAVVYPNDIYLGILLTFSFSILIIYSLEFLKKSLVENGKLGNKILATVLFFGLIVVAYLLTCNVTFDYGFIGIMTPVICSLFDFKNVIGFKKLYKLFLRKLCFVLAVILYNLSSGVKYFTFFSLFTIPLILLYSGKRGKLKLKYFFYAFYPLHLLVLAGLQLIIN